MENNLIKFEIENLPQLAKDIEQTAKAIVIFDNKDYENAGNLAVKCQSVIKKIEDQRKLLKAPILEQGKAIDKQAKELIAPFENAKKQIQNSMREYMTVLEKERAKIEQETEQETGHAVTVLNEPAKNSGLQVRKSLKAEVTDVKSFIKWLAKHIDDSDQYMDFIEVKESKITAFMTANPLIKIDGVKVETKETLITKSK